MRELFPVRADLNLGIFCSYVHHSFIDDQLSIFSQRFHFENGAAASGFCQTVFHRCRQGGDACLFLDLKNVTLCIDIFAVTIES
jgi:hypothetical protein